MADFYGGFVQPPNGGISYRLHLQINLVSQSIEANTSFLQWYCWIEKSASGTGFYDYPGVDWAAYADGQTLLYQAGTIPNAPWTGGSAWLLGSGTFTVSHASDGSKVNMPVSADFVRSASGWAPGTMTTGTQYMTLPTIPRATTPVLSDSTPDTGEAVTVTLTPASSGFSHRLYWAFQPGTGGTAIDNKINGLAGGSGSATGSVEGASADGTAGNYWGVPSGTRTPTLTIPHAVFEQAVDQVTRTVTLTVETRNGATLIGTKTVTLQVTLAASQKPTIAGITHSEATTSPDVATLIGAYVQAVTKLALALTSPAGIHGSTIVSRSITVAGQTLTANGTTPNPINASGTVAITATVTDSRGRVSDVATQNVTVLAWSPPQFATIPAVVRALSSGVTDEDDGTYLKVDPADFSASSLVVSATQKNKIEYRLSYRLVGAGSWTVDGAGWIDPPNTPSVIRFTGTALSTFGSAALGSAYEVLIEIRDVLATSILQRTVPKAQVLLHLKGSLGVAIGARHSGAANPLEIWGRGKQASDETTLRNIIDQGDLDTAIAALLALAAPTGVIEWTVSETAPSGWLLCDGSTVSRTTYADLFAACNPVVGTATVTIASPGVWTRTSHGLYTGQMVYLTTTGALPTGLAQNTAYFVIRVTADTFRLATSLANARAGTAINTSGTQSGTHTVRRTFGVGNGSTTFTLPDLKGKMLVGRDTSQAEFDAIGETGGAKTHTLAESEMPSHTHAGQSGSAFVATGGTTAWVGGSSGFRYFSTTAATGGGGAHENMSPYMALNGIIKV